MIFRNISVEMRQESDFEVTIRVGDGFNLPIGCHGEESLMRKFRSALDYCRAELLDPLDKVRVL